MVEAEIAGHRAALVADPNNAALHIQLARVLARARDVHRCEVDAYRMDILQHLSAALEHEPTLGQTILAAPELESLHRDLELRLIVHGAAAAHGAAGGARQRHGVLAEHRGLWSQLAGDLPGARRAEVQHLDIDTVQWLAGVVECDA